MKPFMRFLNLLNVFVFFIVQEILVNWNYNQLVDNDLTEETTVQIIVTNLDPAVDDAILSEAFKSFHMSYVLY